MKYSKLTHVLFLLATCLLSFLFRNHLLRIEPSRLGRKDTEFSQYPRHPITGLRPNTQPIFETVRLEPNLFDAIFAGNGIVCANNLQEFSVPWSLVIRCHHAIERGMGPPKSLEPQTNHHGYG